MNRRRFFLAAASLAVLGIPRNAVGQQPGKVWRVGLLTLRARPASIEADIVGEFPRALRSLGYVEGQNVVIEWRFAGFDYDRLPVLATELVGLKVDVIVTDGTSTALAAQQATRSIPIVFGVPDAVAGGLVKSLAQPEGNATGVSEQGYAASVKQLEMLRSIVPGLTRVGVLVNPRSVVAKQMLKNLRAAAEALKVELLPLEVQRQEEMEKAFVSMVRQRAEAFSLIADPLWDQLKDEIVRLELKYRLPGMGYPRWGGLFFYGQNSLSRYRPLASFVDRILRGASPRELPVEQPTKFELTINPKTFKALGLKIPPEVALLADTVIE